MGDDAVEKRVEDDFGYYYHNCKFFNAMKNVVRVYRKVVLKN